MPRQDDLNNLADALAAFKLASSRLRAAWSAEGLTGNEMDDYPDYLPDFDSVDIDIQAMTVDGAEHRPLIYLLAVRDGTDRVVLGNNLSREEQSPAWGPQAEMDRRKAAAKRMLGDLGYSV